MRHRVRKIITARVTSEYPRGRRTPTAHFTAYFGEETGRPTTAIPVEGAGDFGCVTISITRHAGRFVRANFNLLTRRTGADDTGQMNGIDLNRRDRFRARRFRCCRRRWHRGFPVTCDLTLRRKMSRQTRGPRCTARETATAVLLRQRRAEGRTRNLLAHGRSPELRLRDLRNASPGRGSSAC